MRSRKYISHFFGDIKLQNDEGDMKEIPGESFTKWLVWGCNNNAFFHSHDSMTFAGGESTNNKTELWYFKFKTSVEGTNITWVGDNRRSEVSPSILGDPNM